MMSSSKGSRSLNQVILLCRSSGAGVLDCLPGAVGAGKVLLGRDLRRWSDGCRGVRLTLRLVIPLGGKYDPPPNLWALTGGTCPNYSGVVKRFTGVPH